MKRAFPATRRALLLSAWLAACAQPTAAPTESGVIPFQPDASPTGSAGAGAGSPSEAGAPDAPMTDAGAPHDDGSPVSPDGAPSDAGSPPDGGQPPDTSTAGAPLGASVEASGVVFRVWAPGATAAAVTGDFPEAKVAMQPTAKGVFEAHVAGAHAGSSYGYSFESPSGTIDRLDPYCRELSKAACLVVDPGAYAWSSPGFTRPARSASVVYELHVGSFAADPSQTAPAGTLASAQAKLGSLADLGVNVVELMPVHDFGGKNGWGYNPQLWLAPKPTYGTSDELRAFVDAAHKLGIAVWLDIVVNHYDGYKKAPLACFDGDCPGGSAGVYFFGEGPYAKTPWGPRPDFQKPEVAAMLRASVEQWLVEYHGDGFRWDSVSNIRALDGAGSVPGGSELLRSANDRIHELGGASVAEDLKGWDGITRPTASGGLGFDAQWDGFGYAVTSVLAAPQDDARDMGAVESALTGSYGGDPFARLIFTEDHDTVGNSGARLPSLIDPADPTSLPARKRSMLGAVLLFTAPGVPMIFMGQESLATGNFGSPPSPLAPATSAGQKVMAFYRDMIRLRRNGGGKAGGLLEAGVEVHHRNDKAKVIAYLRHGASGEDVLVVLNFANKAYTEYDIGAPSAGPWQVRMNTEQTAYGDDFAQGQTGAVTAAAKTKDGKPFSLPLKLAPYSAMVLTL